MLKLGSDFPFYISGAYVRDSFTFSCSASIALCSEPRKRCGDIFDGRGSSISSRCSDGSEPARCDNPSSHQLDAEQPTFTYANMSVKMCNKLYQKLFSRAE